MHRAIALEPRFLAPFGLSVSLVLAASAALLGCVDVPLPPATKSPTPSPKASPAASASWLVEDFESARGKSGGFWCAFDHNGLGTQVSPDPFVLTAGGAPPSRGQQTLEQLRSDRAADDARRLACGVTARDHTVEVTEGARGPSFGLSAQDHAMHYEIVRE
jgi:hypothetical protein